MKFSCTQENLHQGLSIVSHIANKHINLPILGNVLMKAEDSGLRFFATNLEIAVSCSVRGKIEEKGEFTIPSRLFSDYVGLLPKERVDILQKDQSIAVSCGSYHTILNGISASEFPLIPTVERQKGFSVDIADIKRAVSQVLFAVAANETRPEISGVLFRFTKTPQGDVTLTLAATDSYRLAEKTIPAQIVTENPVQDTFSMIVPSRTVAELMRALGVFRDAFDDTEKLHIYSADNQILFSFANMELVSRTIEGKYPDYRQLIPDRYETEATLQKDDLVRAVKATSLFSKNGLNDIQMTFNPEGGMNITAANSQTGTHEVEIPGKITGKTNTVTVNFRYLLDGVNNSEGEEVHIQLIDGISPCVLKPTKEQSHYLYIVMPIRQ